MVILLNVGILMLFIFVMENENVVLIVVYWFGSVVFKLLFFMKVWGMCVFDVGVGDSELWV